MRVQASEVTRVHSVYVVDNDDILLGRLSLKDLLVADPKTKIKSIYKSNVEFVFDYDSAEYVANTMQKYDLGAIPVIDKSKKLLGRITIDDIVDLIKEEAEEDYQLAAGILQDVDVDDSIIELTRARLPWLILGLIGGIGAAFIMGGFDEILIENKIVPEKNFMLNSIKMNSTDPIHLNDIEPALSDTKYWKKGDVFINNLHF